MASAASLNITAINCYYHSHTPPPCKNVPIRLSHHNNNINNNKNKNKISFSPLTFHHNNNNNSLLSLVQALPTSSVQEELLPPALDSTSHPPPVFDGTTRLYISYTCPYAQRVWITRNCKGLYETIKLVPIDLKNRPEWYKEKVYAPNKVPALEHNNEVKGESLDLIKYIDTNFEGPSLYPDDPVKKEFGEELLYLTLIRSINLPPPHSRETGLMMLVLIIATAAAFDFVEQALSKFDDGPFFLGQFSLVDIAYAPFIERFQPYLLEVKKYDIKVGRPKLTAWVEEMNKNDDYNQTRRDPKELVESYKKRYLSPS